MLSVCSAGPGRLDLVPTVTLDADGLGNQGNAHGARCACSDQGDWGEVSVGKGTVRVTEVSAGQEDRLRHFLESVVEQANAGHDLPGDDDGAESEAGPAAPAGPDADMTERFRSFASD